MNPGAGSRRFHHAKRLVRHDNLLDFGGNVWPMIDCSNCGVQNVPTATHCCRCGTELLPPPLPDAVQKTSADLPAPKFIEPAVVADSFIFAEDFHHADWDRVRQWIETSVSAADQETAWNEAVLLWLMKLRDDLGGDYFVLQSHQTILLCDQARATARWLLDYASRAAATIKEQLGETARRGTFGKDVILVFCDQDDYYQYLAYHSPDGEQAASGGVCIHSGYPHIALPWHDEFEAANTIVHELTHNCLAHLPLPLWLNEGVAVTLQKAIAPPPRSLAQGDQSALFAAAINWQSPIMWDELAERHFSFWTGENIQSFWAGTSFFEPGDPNELSYILAEVFVKLLTERSDGQTFRAFLEAAHQDDAGQAAAMDILGVQLGDIAATFLGEGQWCPQRRAMVACWEAAGWKRSGNSEGVPW